jgi:hypothetical protein
MYNPILQLEVQKQAIVGLCTFLLNEVVASELKVLLVVHTRSLRSLEARETFHSTCIYCRVTLDYTLLAET